MSRRRKREQLSVKIINNITAYINSHHHHHHKRSCHCHWIDSNQITFLIIIFAQLTHSVGSWSCSWLYYIHKFIFSYHAFGFNYFSFHFILILHPIHPIPSSFHPFIGSSNSLIHSSNSFLFIPFHFISSIFIIIKINGEIKRPKNWFKNITELINKLKSTWVIELIDFNFGCWSWCWILNQETQEQVKLVLKSLCLVFLAFSFSWITIRGWAEMRCSLRWTWKKGEKNKKGEKID